MKPFLKFGLPLCFFLSGASGLCYELIWNKLLVQVIGASAHSISIILGVFLGGIGLGAYLISKKMDSPRLPRSKIQIYAGLEIFIGVYAFILPWFLKLLKPFFAWNYQQFYNLPILYQIILIAGCAVILLPPTLAMGASFPLVLNVYTKSTEVLGKKIGWLYGLNTVGGGLGILFCGFWSFYHWGIFQTSILAAVVNLFIGIYCWINKDKEVELPTSKAEKTTIYKDKLVSKLILTMMVISGFFIIGMELLWSKLLGLVMGPTTYSFTIVLFVFVFGLGMGSLSLSRFIDRRQDKLFSTLLIIILLIIGFSLGASQVIGMSQLFFAKLSFKVNYDFNSIHIFKVLIISIITFPATFCMGAFFPIACTGWLKWSGKKSSEIGIPYGWNTLGNVLGAIITGHLLLPFLGKENSIRVLCLLLIFSAFIALLLIYKKEKKKSLIAGSLTIVVVIILCYVFPKWNRDILSKSNSYFFGEELNNINWVESFTKADTLLGKSKRQQRVYYADGLSGFTSVWKETNLFGKNEFSLFISGKADASSRTDMFTQTLLAHYPMLLHPNPKNIMVMGLASGVTAGEVLNYRIDDVDVLEINREVVNASEYFKPWNGDVLNNAKVNLIVHDAKSHLMLSNNKYDVIISEPSNPWMAGLAELFTLEFVKEAYEHLNPEGVYVQFVHSYQMNWEGFEMIGKTFSKIFTNTQLVRTLPSSASGLSSDYLLIGVKSKRRPELQDSPEKIKALNKSINVHLDKPSTLYRMIESENLTKLFHNGEIHTDNHPNLEYLAPKLMYQYVQQNITGQLEKFRIRSSYLIDTVSKLENNHFDQLAFAKYAFSVFKPFPNMINEENLDSIQIFSYVKSVKKYCSEMPLENFSVFEGSETLSTCSAVLLGMYTKRLRDEQNKPDFQEIWLDMGRICAINGAIKNALEFYLKASEGEDLKIAEQAYKQRSKIFSSMGRTDLATQEFLKAKNRLPKSENMQ